MRSSLCLVRSGLDLANVLRWISLGMSPRTCLAGAEPNRHPRTDLNVTSSRRLAWQKQDTMGIALAMRAGVFRRKILEDRRELTRSPSTGASPARPLQVASDINIALRSILGRVAGAFGLADAKYALELDLHPLKLGPSRHGPMNTVAEPNITAQHPWALSVPDDININLSPS